jgi:hypothetical protein
VGQYAWRTRPCGESQASVWIQLAVFQLPPQVAFPTPDAGDKKFNCRPVLSAVQINADWCVFARETPVFPGFFAFSRLPLSMSSDPFSVQSGAIRSVGDADRTALFSAPLGTTVGTFL